MRYVPLARDMPCGARGIYIISQAVTIYLADGSPCKAHEWVAE